MVILTFSLVGLLVLLPLLDEVVAFSTLPSPLRSKQRIHTNQATSTNIDGDDHGDNHDNKSRTYTANMRKKVAGMIAKEKQREQERSVVSRPTCERCYRPPQLCVCSSLPPNNKKLTTQKTSIWILQHPNEFRKRNWSTVPLLKLVLENIKVKVGYSFDFDDLWGNTTSTTTTITNVDSKEYDNQPPIPLLLFPGPDAVDLDVLTAEGQLPASNPLGDPLSERKNDNNNNNNNNNHILVLIDGTWSEAKKMLRESPTLLERCKLIQFSSSSMEEQQTPSIYNAVRKEPEAHCLSTLEACAMALQYLERTTNATDDDDVQKYLYNVLETHVNAHLENARVIEPRIKYKNDPKSKERQRLEIESSRDLI